VVQAMMWVAVVTGIALGLLGLRLAYLLGYLKACNDINEALEREHRLTWERHQREISDANKAVQQQQSMTGRRPDGL